MPNRKLKLAYDVSVIKNGYWPSSSRSGVFFAALNILKELAKREDIDLVLSCEDTDFCYIKCVLEREIPDINFRFKKNNSFLVFYGRLKLLKRFASENKEYRKKILLQFLQLIVSPVSKLVSFFREKNTFEDFDAFLSPAYFISKHVKTKKYTLLYDLISLKFPEFRYSSWKKGFWLYDLCSTLNGNESYFTISEHTRKDFLKSYPQIDPEKITTTLLACDNHFKPSSIQSIESVKEKYKIPSDRKYLFSLCSLEPRKNLKRSVRTFIEFIRKNNITDMVFVLGGGHWKSFIKQLENTIDDLGDYKEKILKIGYVADEDLSALYSGAEWFVYTSAYEGFGLPPLEAMSCGCPVIASNNSSLPEVVGDAGIMIDWDSDEQHRYCPLSRLRIKDPRRKQRGI